MALTQTQQQILTETDRGTPMGELFRRYWIPAMLAGELPEPDCDPVQIRLLGEDLLGFRDTAGNFGLVQEFCPHRGVSLFYGRNEECGIRCSYHGWKFDVQGRCVDMPSEPDESSFKDKVRLTAYKLIERGGVLWAYMGPPESEPPPPELEWTLLPAEQRYVSKRIQECNYLQALEGGIDSSHVSTLHRFNLDDDPMHEGAHGNVFLKADTRPKFEVHDSPSGLLIGARRAADDANDYWRITPFIMPWYTIIPPFGRNVIGAHAFVPMDDENCWTWSINYEPTRALTADEVAAMDAGMGIHVEYVPGTFRPKANRDNHYLIDRAAQRARKSFSGVKGISMQDASLQESMGRIVDRTNERLGTSDAAIIAARRTLLHAAEANGEGGPPPMALEPAAQYVRSASILIPKGVPFAEGAAEARRAAPNKPFASV
jgi:phenylpropionate dioxygenase-like ring-hydroxylating dioxygenase large terminal subunit